MPSGGGRIVQLGTHRAAIISISTRAPPSPIKSSFVRPAISAAVCGSAPSVLVSSLGLTTAMIRVTVTPNRNTPATIHCQMRVRAAGEAASRRACISGVEAARRAAPRPPRMLKAVVIAMVRGTAKAGMTTGMSAG
mgnify:CR=1 FL=1